MIWASFQNYLLLVLLFEIALSVRVAAASYPIGTKGNGLTLHLLAFKACVAQFANCYVHTQSRFCI